MAQEQKYNKEAKMQLFKRIAHKQAARQKYPRALPATTAVSEQTKAMVHIKKGQREVLSRAEETLSTTATPVRLQTFREKQQKPFNLLTAKIYQKHSNVVRSLHFLCDIDSESLSYEWTNYPASLFEPRLRRGE
ncbi:hypothetical protein LSAT2_032890, partial [Lamellibrachia satsuma]